MRPAVRPSSSPRRRVAASAATAVATWLALAVGAVLGAPAAAHAQMASDPSLRLVATTGAVAASPWEAGMAPDLGLWVAAVGGDVRLEVRRVDYRRWDVRQVDAATGRTIRVIPARLLDGWRGFERFLRVRFVDARGRTAARVSSGFCLGGFGSERLDDTGPRTSRYGAGCGFASPFALGTVWGIDAGWAARAPLLSELDLPRGRYTAIAAIAPAVRRAFDIPVAHATARVRVRIPRPPRRRPSRSVKAAASHVPSAAPAVPNGRPEDAGALPDLVALPAWDIVTRRRGERDQLRFSSTAWNAGPAPLTVEGFRRPPGDVMDAYQYFEDASRAIVGRTPAGTMGFHRGGGHDHWHFLQFASYRLLDARRRRVARARKQSFCLMPTDAIDLTLPRAPLGSETTAALTDRSSCGQTTSLWIRQTLPVGFGDTYHRSFGGQAFDITTVPNGRYLVEIRVNPLGDLQETDSSNNVQLRRIRLGGRPGARTVRVSPWRGLRR